MPDWPARLPVKRESMIIFGFFLLGMAMGALLGLRRPRERFGMAFVAGFGAMAGGVLLALLEGTNQAELWGLPSWLGAAGAAGLALAAQHRVSRSGPLDDTRGAIDPEARERLHLRLGLHDRGR